LAAGTISSFFSVVLRQNESILMMTALWIILVIGMVDSLQS